MLMFKPHTLTTIRQEDIVELDETFEEFLNMDNIEQLRAAPKLLTDSQKRTNLIIKGEYQLEWEFGFDWIPGDQRRNTPRNRRIRNDYSSLASVGTDILALRSNYDKLNKSEVPMIPFGSADMGPKAILKSLDLLQVSFDNEAAEWSNYASIILSKPIIKPQLKNLEFRHFRGLRFIIQPLIDVGQDIYALIILDFVSNDWIYINVANESNASLELYGVVNDVIRQKNQLRLSASRVIINNTFHQEYPVIHLLFALFTIRKLFRYAVKLPQKIVYGEHHFRLFCFLTLYEKQLSNHEYNISRKLVDTDGHVLPGGRMTSVSFLKYQHVVIPVDLCMFCKTRGYNNLGRHIAMKHGGQALRAYESRQC